MRLAILGDTHLPRGARRIPQRCLAECARADAILHTGDLAQFAVLEELRSLGPPVHAVRGNADGTELAALLPDRLELELEAVRLAMVHNPGPRAERLRRLRARFPAADAVVFGHTHVPEHARDDGFQIFNPGSPTERRRLTPALSMGRARIRGRRIDFELITLD